MGAVLDLPALDPVHQSPQLRRVALPAALDGGLAGHGVEKVVPPLLQAPAGAELGGALLQRGGGVRGVDVRGQLPEEHRAVAEVLAGEAQPFQKGQVFQDGGGVLPAQLHGDGGKQRLTHGGLLGGLQPVKIDALVGRVLVDEVDAAVLALADDVGVQDLPGDAPGGLPGLQGLLAGDLRLQRRDGRGQGGLLRPGRRRRNGGAIGLFWRFRDGQGLLPGGGIRRRRLGRRLFRRSGRGAAPGLVGDALPAAVRHGGAAVPLRVPGGGCRPDRLRLLLPGGGAIRRRCAGELDRGLGRLRDAGGGLLPLPEVPGVQALEEVVPGVRDLCGLGSLGGQGGAVGVQAVHHRVVDGVEGLLLPGELHLGLGGVDVDIHQRQGQRHVEDAAGEAAL